MLRRLFLAALLTCIGAPAAAQTQEFLGTPVILPSGDLMLEGRDIVLWGIDPLASDQQCWHDNLAWDCGQQSLMALAHYTEGHVVNCRIISDLGDGRMSAQCFLERGDQGEDLARYMVFQGWARDLRDVSNGIYAADETDAWRNGRGIWTSRFQTPSDWRNGIQRYVDYQLAPPPTPVYVAEPAPPPLVIQNPYLPVATGVPFGTVIIIHGGSEHDNDQGHDKDRDANHNADHDHDKNQTTAGNPVPAQKSSPIQVGVPAGTVPVGVPRGTVPVGVPRGTVPVGGNQPNTQSTPAPSDHDRNEGHDHDRDKNQ